MNNEEPQARAPTPLATCDDELLLPISALNDLLFCERRAAMHLIEQVWQDNPHTLEGSYAHERADIPKDVVEHGVRAVHGVLLRSNRLRLVGKADVVEFHEMKNEERKMKNEQVEAGRQQNAVLPDSQPNLTSSLFVAHSSFFISSASTLVPYPVDYKRGRKRRWDNDDVQLCAQALCLEEMLGVDVPHGAIFHIKSKRRREVEFDWQLRRETEDAAQRVHELVSSGRTPPAVPKARCKGCSLRELCMPELLPSDPRLQAYRRTLYEGANEE